MSRGSKGGFDHRRNAHPDLRHAKAGMLGCYAQVARSGNFQTRAQTITRYSRDDGNRQVAQGSAGFMQKCVMKIRADSSSNATHLVDVRAADESAISCAG